MSLSCQQHCVRSGRADRSWEDSCEMRGGPTQPVFAGSLGKMNESLFKIFFKCLQSPVWHALRGQEVLQIQPCGGESSGAHSEYRHLKETLYWFQYSGCQSGRQTWISSGEPVSVHDGFKTGNQPDIANQAKTISNTIQVKIFWNKRTQIWATSVCTQIVSKHVWYDHGVNRIIA